MDVSENSGTPKSSILIGFSIINHPFWGTPIFGNTHIFKYARKAIPQKIVTVCHWNENGFPTSSLLKMAPRHDQAQKSTAEVPEIGESKAPFFLLGSAAGIWSRKSFIPSLLKVKLSYFLGIFFCGKFKERWVDEIPFHLLEVYISLAIDIFGDWTLCNPICNIHLQGCFLGLKAIFQNLSTNRMRTWNHVVLANVW